MKTLFAAAMAVSLLTGGLAVQADGRDDRDRGRQYDRDRDHDRRDLRGHDRRDDRRDNRQHDRRDDRRDDRRHARDDDRRHDNRHYDHRRDDRRYDNHRGNWDRRDVYRSGYAQGRFDQHRFNRGRYLPPRGYYVRHWRHGDRLPSAYYSSRYVVHDYHSYHLHSPPRGYHWVRVNNDVLLAAITSGVVVSVVNGLFY